jgi:hypothetical protein
MVMTLPRRMLAQFGFALAAFPALAQPSPAPIRPTADVSPKDSPFVAPPGGELDTRIGRLRFTRGYPDEMTTRLLFDNLDLQRAIQAYIWALPIVAFAEWQDQHRAVFGASETDMVLYTSFKDKLGLLTANATTPYILGFHDLARTGPLVIDLPAGETAGGVGDFWQRSLGDYGQAGPDRGQGGRYLLLGPGQNDPKAAGHHVLRSSTNNVFNGFRILSTDPAVGSALLAKYRVYPYAQRDNPPPTRLLRPEGRAWSGTQPRGIAYWKRLAVILNDEPVQERDRFFMAMLRPLGIIKGQPFQPDARQAALLEEGVLLGEATARVMDVENRFAGATFWEGRHWHWLMLFDVSQRQDGYEALDERSTWFYEAVTAAAAMAIRQPGPGQVYLGVNKDAGGEWLDGGSNYRLRIPADVPAQQFWSVTAYDLETRCFIDTPHERADRGSRDALVKNADGSTDLFFGPRPPAGQDTNWVPTGAGRGWFAYFRLYYPEAPFFAKSWQLPDLERLG